MNYDKDNKDKDNSDDRDGSAPLRSAVGRPPSARSPRSPEGAGAGDVEALLDEMIEAQRSRLLALALRIAPNLTADDLLQPHDDPRVAAHPDFQFEDGILAGYLSVRAALRASR